MAGQDVNVLSPDGIFQVTLMPMQTRKVGTSESQRPGAHLIQRRVVMKLKNRWRRVKRSTLRMKRKREKWRNAQGSVFAHGFGVIG